MLRRLYDLIKIFFTISFMTVQCSMVINKVHKYLLMTGQQLEIDMFNFDWWVQVVFRHMTFIPKILFHRFFRHSNHQRKS